MEEVSELEFENKSLTFEREENSEENIVAEESNSGNEEIDADPISYQAKSSEKVISADEDKEVKRESTPEEILANRLRELSNREPEEAALNESSIDETVEKEIEWPETTATGNEEIEVPEFIRVRRDSREARMREQELKRENEQHTFLDWLKIKDIPVIPTDKISEYFKKEELTDAGSDKVGDALIDQFIKTEPRIVPARSEFYSPGNMARQSAVDHEELISETLARIYAQQGNIPKAIEAYKRLSLKSPEKSSYFAALIRELEQKES